MTDEDIFEAWAPSGARWSEWVKPVLFVAQPESAPDEFESDDFELEPAIDFELPPALDTPGVAWVVDLPGTDSVAVGLALAKLGIRPVPLFNAVPGGANSLVDLEGIQRALLASVDALRRAHVPSDAPPAFLLDSLRRVARRDFRNRRYFDNRSVSFSSDFPSGSTLRAHGIQRIVLLRRWYLLVPGDLIGTLAAWHAAGLAIEIHDVEAEQPPQAWAPPRLVWLHRLWSQTLVPLALKRDDSGAFGGFVPASHPD